MSVCTLQILRVHVRLLCMCVQWHTMMCSRSQFATANKSNTERQQAANIHLAATTSSHNVACAFVCLSALGALEVFAYYFAPAQIYIVAGSRSASLRLAGCILLSSAPPSIRLTGWQRMLAASPATDARCLRQHHHHHQHHRCRHRQSHHHHRRFSISFACRICVRTFTRKLFARDIIIIVIMRCQSQHTHSQNSTNTNPHIPMSHLSHHLLPHDDDDEDNGGSGGHRISVVTRATPEKRKCPRSVRIQFARVATPNALPHDSVYNFIKREFLI